MNLVKSQDTKSIYGNPLHSYTLTTKKSERELKKTIPFTTATKRIKYLGINDLWRDKRPVYRKLLRHWWKISKTKQTERYITFLEESVLWKWLYYSQQSTD